MSGAKQAFHDHFSDAPRAHAPVWGTDGARRVVMPLHFLCGKRRDA